MANSPKPRPDSTVSAGKGITGKFSHESHRETCPERLASCVPMGCLATPMEFLRPTGRDALELRREGRKSASAASVQKLASKIQRWNFEVAFILVEGRSKSRRSPSQFPQRGFQYLISSNALMQYRAVTLGDSLLVGQ